MAPGRAGWLAETVEPAYCCTAMPARDPGLQGVKGRLRDDVGITTAVPRIADDLLQRSSRQSWANCGLTLTKLLWERMLEEQTQHFPGCVRSSRISVGSRRAASRPCVSSSVDVPALKDSAPTRVGIDRAGIGMPSRYPPAMHLLLRARRSHELLKNLIAVVWMHHNVAIAVKNNGRDRWPVT